MLDRCRIVVVVGAGMAGLSAAIDLARRGHRVALFERHREAGGKLREVLHSGMAIDSGPTVLTLRAHLDALFEDAGASIDDFLALRPLETLARHAWSETERLDLFFDKARTEEAIGQFAGALAAREYRAFALEARGIYEALESRFIASERPSVFGLVRRFGVKGLPSLMRIRPYATLWSALARNFSDVRLRQLFARYATYCGSSPFQAPATLMLIAHVEGEGVWTVVGGMKRIVEALVSLARSLGVDVQCNREVTQIRVSDGRVKGVEISDGEVIEADAVIANVDVGALACGLLGPEARRAVPPVERGMRSLSALTWSLSGQVEGFPLVRHNVFFSRDYAAEFAELRAGGRVAREPTVYVCAQDRGDDPDNGLPARERLFCLVNAPPDGDRLDYGNEEIEQCWKSARSRLESCGLSIKESEHPAVVTTPTDFARMFPGTGGALYGQATHGSMGAFRRPGSRSRISGLYLAGGSVHPGPGLPMALLSGRLAASSLTSDWASTGR